MKTYTTYTEYLADCTERTANSHRPPAAPYAWTCDTCGKVSPNTEPYGLSRAPAGMHCYACCHARDVAQMLDRSKPFGAYLSSDGKTITNWPGYLLGTVTREAVSRTGFHSSKITHIRVTDVHGGKWYGKGGGRGIYVTLRACKS